MDTGNRSTLNRACHDSEHHLCGPTTSGMVAAAERRNGHGELQTIAPAAPPAGETSARCCRRCVGAGRRPRRWRCWPPRRRRGRGSCCRRLHCRPCCTSPPGPAAASLAAGFESQEVSRHQRTQVSAAEEPGGAAKRRCVARGRRHAIREAGQPLMAREPSDRYQRSTRDSRRQPHG